LLALGISTASAYVLYRVADQAQGELDARTKTQELALQSAQNEGKRLEVDLEKERVARLQLEKKLAPRLLSQDDALTLANMLAPFKGAAIDMVVFPTGTSDIGPFEDQLYRAFNAAGWTVRHWTMLGSEFVVGVGVALAPDATPDDAARANAVVAALESVGVEAALAPKLQDKSFPTPATGSPPQGVIAPLRLYVGTKPP
jgi:hypothetical protein